MLRFEIFAFTKYCELETLVKVYSRSLEMTSFDTPYL